MPSSVSDTSCSSFFFFSSRRRHTIFDCDWSSDVCSSDLPPRARSDGGAAPAPGLRPPLGERAASHLVGGLLSALRGVAGGGRVHRARAQASAALRTLRHGVGDPTAALRVL